MSETQERVTVIGTGNAGLTTAYALAKAGNKVCLYGAPGFDEQIAQIDVRGGINSVKTQDATALNYFGFAAIHKLTRDIHEAVEYAGLLFMPVPAFAQEPLFRAMLPYLHDGQTIVLMPGNYGSLALNQVKIAAGYPALHLSFVDAISIPWACRIVGPAEIAIFGRKNNLPMAAFPAMDAPVVLPKIENALKIPIPCLQNVIQAGLENINFGAHPLLTILNIGLLENFEGNYNFYSDCCSPAIAKAGIILDAERLSTGLALGIPLKSELDAMNDLYGTTYPSVYDFNRNSATHIAIHGAPGSSQHRYISEDIPYLLVPCLQFARLTQVDTPILRALIQLANVFNQTDYEAKGRTLDKMGLAGLSIDQILHFVTD